MELWTAWMLGLVGSLHCAGMCGPLALALPAPSTQAVSYVLGRLVYNAGRVITYALMGVVFGLLGRTLALAGIQQWVSLALGIALLVGLLAAPRLAMSGPVARAVGRLKQLMGVYLRTRTLGALGALGLLNGLLPCGLVYVACAGAAATGEVVGGLLYMGAFGLGTVPMMLAISLSGKLVHATLRHWLARAVPVSVALVAVLLIVRGLGLGIPYLSPNLGATSRAACCHPGSDSAEEAPAAVAPKESQTP
jgi:uncharacterized protein